MSDRPSDRQPLNEHAANARRRVTEEAVEISSGLSADSGLAPPMMRVRKPFGNRDQKLAYPSRPGYHRHWFNDEPGRIMKAQDAGYEHVKNERDQPVQMVVGIGRGGQPQIAFLMETLQQWYDEDMAAQDDVVLSLMQEIGRGDYARPAGVDGGARYVPDSTGTGRGDISIRHTTGRR